ncbi:uncharacterized protein TNCV_4505391 [Trichonephila clavipes]|nr:uncharacterized protein TNCV_4505391 [Trichonephila clavipes]
MGQSIDLATAFASLNMMEVQGGLWPLWTKNQRTHFLRYLHVQSPHRILLVINSSACRASTTLGAVKLLLSQITAWKKLGAMASEEVGLLLVGPRKIFYPPSIAHRKTTTRGLLASAHVILNHGQVTWTTPELAPPLLTTTPHQREDVSALDRFNVHHCPTRRVFSGTGLEPVTKQATVRYLYHSATAAECKGIGEAGHGSTLVVTLPLSLPICSLTTPISHISGPCGYFFPL